MLSKTLLWAIQFIRFKVLSSIFRFEFIVVLVLIVLLLISFTGDFLLFDQENKEPQDNASKAIESKTYYREIC